MREPASMSPGSIMPNYAWLLEQTLDKSKTVDKLKAMKSLGVPYDDYAIMKANQDLDEQAASISGNLAKEGVKVSPDKEIVALIAYLQRLGTDIKKAQ
jgi:cytochrome c oxidase cbb3-type subunit I/II